MTRYLNAVAWLLLAAALGLCAWSAVRWVQLGDINRLIEVREWAA